jgi:hypothetical protein
MLHTRRIYSGNKEKLGKRNSVSKKKRKPGRRKRRQRSQALDSHLKFVLLGV